MAVLVCHRQQASPPQISRRLLAPNNGAIEHTQGEFKRYRDRWGWKAYGIA